MRSNNNSIDEKDYLAICQKEYKETNPFGYKDYKETFDNIHWWKTVEYTDENGEKVVKDINPFGQVMIHQFINIKENTGKKEEKNLDNDSLDDWDFDDSYYNMDYTPDTEPDEKNLSEKDFFKMDWKETQYQ